jgi:predicted RND superfamily exporter protein
MRYEKVIEVLFMMFMAVLSLTWAVAILGLLGFFWYTVYRVVVHLFF